MVKRVMKRLLHENDNALLRYLWTSISVQDILARCQGFSRIGFHLDQRWLSYVRYGAPFPSLTRLMKQEPQWDLCTDSSFCQSQLANLVQRKLGWEKASRPVTLIARELIAGCE